MANEIQVVEVNAHWNGSDISYTIVNAAGETMYGSTNVANIKNHTTLTLADEEKNLDRIRAGRKEAYPTADEAAAIEAAIKAAGFGF